MKFLSLNGLTEYNDQLLNKVDTMIDNKTEGIQSQLNNKSNTNHTHNYIPLSGSTAISGVLRTNSEYQTTSQNGFRIVSGDYGLMLRNDSANTYFLLTNSGDPYGSWNNLRPFSINNSTGEVTMSNGINGNLNGTATRAGTATVSESCSGNSATATTSNSIGSSGYGSGNLTYLQTSDQFNDNSGWCHYLIANHGNGETYYNYMIGLPFYSSPMYRRQTGNASSKSDWHKFYTTENITYGTSALTAGSSSLSTGSIYLQYE